MTKLYLCDISNFIKEAKENEKFLEGFFDKIGVERMQYILNKKKAEDRARSLGAALLLLFALQKEIPEIKTLPDFSYKENDKPYIQGLSNIFFNLSHTKNIVTCVISDKEVGVDIEHIRDLKETTIRKVFTDKEKKRVQGERKGYIRLWTMKEAYAKLTGKGLKEILDGLEIIETEENIKIQKLNQDIRKTSCSYVVAEGEIFDAYECSYLYSVCTKIPCVVQQIYTKWEEL